jgi:hypothetical protein
MLLAKLPGTIFSSKKKIIYLTTNSGYGIGEKSKFCDENTPLKPRTIKEILENKEPKKKSIMEEDYKKRSPAIQEALYEALKNIQQKEKENGNDKKETS